jgi:hypothetical protein
VVQALYAEGLDTPIERSVHLVLRLAAGDADALSGRYLSVEDDLDALVKQFAAEPSADQRMLRLNGIAAFLLGLTQRDLVSDQRHVLAKDWGWKRL